MAFPDTPLDVLVELMISGAWVDITADVYAAEKIVITRGRADEGARVDPGKCTLTLNNRLGKYSPRNPLSDYFELIGRNTPIRVSVPGNDTRLELDGDAANNASTPDHADLDITGDLDIRWEGEADWYAPGSQILIGKWGESGVRSYNLRLQDGSLYLHFSTDGTLGLWGFRPLPQLPRHAAVRGTLDADNGAGGWTIRLYWAETLAGPWEQIGDDLVTTGGTATIFSGTAALSIAPEQGDSSPPRTPVAGRVYAAEVRSGIDGTIVAAPDFTAQSAGTTSFADSAGRTWTLAGTAEITDRNVRFIGEVSSWPSRWDVSGNDVRVPIEAAGILRRLGQGAKALESTLRRRIPSFGPLAYWPMEDGAAATQAYSPLDGVAPLSLTRVNWASASSLASSNPLPVLASSGSNLPVMLGRVPAPSTALTGWHVQWVYRIDNGPATRRTFMRIRAAGGTVAEWLIQSGTDGSNLIGLDIEGATVVTHSIGTGTDLFGQWVRASFAVTQSGSNVLYSITWTDVGGDAGTFDDSLTGTIGRPTAVSSPPDGYSSDLDGMAIGHVSVWSNDLTDAYLGAIDAWTGETAGARMSRLADEEGLPLLQQSLPSRQTQVGPQLPDTLLALLEEAATADGGVLYERRDTVGLTYRDRTSLYNQTVSVELDYTEPGHVAPPLEPVDDDQKVRNDVTVTREGGASGRAVLEEGPLSVQAPPDGVGRYDESVTLSLHEDAQAEPIAYWRLHLGTVDEARYPVLNINLAAAPSLADTVTGLDSGDRLQIANPPAWLPPGPIDLLVQGYTEVIGHPNDWDFQFNCTPASPWTVGVVGDSERGRVDANPAGSTLAVATDADDTLIVVHTPARGAMGPAPWITSAGPSPTYPAEFPYDIRFGGETARVLVNAPAVWDTFNRAEAHGAVLNGNSTFEEDLDGWTGSGATLERVATPELASAPFSGQWSMKVTPDGVAEFPNAGSDMIAVTAGSQYNLSGWLLCATSRNVALNINWFDAASGYLSTSSNDQAVTADTWTHFTLTATAPVGAAFANLAPTVPDFPPATDVAYADQVEFSAVVADTWGRSDGPSTWAETGGLASDRSLNGTAGVITLAANPATIRFQRLVAGLTDTEVLVRMSVGQVATGNALLPSVLLRYVDTGNFYRARLHFGLSGAMSASITRATTAVGSTATLPYTYAAGDWFWVRARLTGQRVQLRVWPDGQLEPAVWHKDETIASDTIASGQVGVTASAFDTNTNVNPQLRYDDFTVITPQLMTVQRSLNGVVKAHAVGAEVRVANPAVVAL